MSCPRWFLILNGKAAGNPGVRAAVHALRQRGVDLQVRVTWEAGDEARWVDEAVAAAADTIIAGGGDGTLGAVAGAMARREERAEALPTLGVLPLGTANDFAAAAQLPVAPAEALALVEAAPAVAIDLLRVRGDGHTRWCINMVSGGFGTEVTRDTDERLKKALGGFAYFLTGLTRLGRIEPIQARLHGEDFAWDGGFVALGIGNGRQAGGGQVLCPQACIDDGEIALTVIPDLQDVVGTLGKLVADGQQAALEHAAVRVALAALAVDAPQALTLNLDGEPLAARHFEIACDPGRVRMHLPPDCPLLAAAAA